MSGPQQPKGGAGKNLPALSEDTIRALIAQQSTEASLRSQEFAIRKQELDYQSKHASDILGAQERDRDAQRTHFRTCTREKYIFWGLGAAALLAFAAWGLMLNKDAVVKDILQMVISATLGAAGGFGAGRASKKAAEKDE